MVVTIVAYLRYQILGHDVVVHHKAAAEIHDDQFNHVESVALVCGDGLGVELIDGEE